MIGVWGLIRERYLDIDSILKRDPDKVVLGPDHQSVKHVPRIELDLDLVTDKGFMKYLSQETSA
jgi:hypothetical protein